ncbi:MAG: hypothetical protein PHP86_09685 [Nevskiales bacterium]|nr:hypothetical protein [Nevskiales bacterium]
MMTLTACRESLTETAYSEDFIKDEGTGEASGELQLEGFLSPVWIRNSDDINVGGFGYGTPQPLPKLALEPGQYRLWVTGAAIGKVTIETGKISIVDARRYLATLHVRNSRQPVYIRNLITGSWTHELFPNFPIMQLPPGKYEIRVGHNNWKDRPDLIVKLNAGDNKAIDVDQHFGFVDVEAPDVGWSIADSNGKGVHCCTLKPGTYGLIVEGQRVDDFEVRRGSVTPLPIAPLLGSIRVTGPRVGDIDMTGRLVFTPHQEDESDARHLYLQPDEERTLIAPPGRYSVRYEHSPLKGGTDIATIEVRANAETTLDLGTYLARIRIRNLDNRYGLVSISADDEAGDSATLHDDRMLWLKPGRYTLYKGQKPLRTLTVEAGKVIELDVSRL